MTTPKTDALMALADRYAFHIPGSQHSDEARAALLAALQEQAREGEADCRIELVTAVHMLASHYENNLYNLNGDEEALRLAKGDIAHAMKIAAKWNWNGSAPQPEQPSEPAHPEQGELTGCACRWDADDNRVATCVRHQGWLDVVHEWAERAKSAETTLQSAQPVALPNIQNQIVKDISRHEPCHTCAHDETCYECRSYWGNKWEAA